MPENLFVRAPGKLVLLGEYAVVEGYPALVAAVDRYAALHTDPSGPPGQIIAVTGQPEAVQLQWKKQGWHATKKAWKLSAMALTAAFGEQAPAVVVDTSPFYLKREKKPPLKAGFGSSAAVTAVMLAAGPQASLEPEVLLRQAREVHQAAHASLGSGIDLAAAVYGGVLAYQLGKRTPRITPLALPPGVHVGVFWSGRSASTSRMLEAVLQWKTLAPAAHAKLMRRMGALSRRGIAAFAAGDAAKFLSAAQAYGEIMAELGQAAGTPIFSSPWRRVAAQLSPVAVVKPSGAGGGDVFLALCHAEDKTKMREAGRALGLQWLEVELGAPGLERREIVE